MLKQTRTWIIMTPSSSSFMSPSLSKLNHPLLCNLNPRIKALNLRVTQERALLVVYSGRRRVRDEDEDELEDDGHNEEVSMLEFYSQSAREEALLVHAVVDDQEVEVLIFKKRLLYLDEWKTLDFIYLMNWQGFSSCLSYKTSPDPSKSVLPARAVIKSIDRIKGPFDPSNIEYLEKGLTLHAFKTSFGPA